MIWGARLWVTAVDGRRPWGLSSAALLAMQIAPARVAGCGDWGRCTDVFKVHSNTARSSCPPSLLCIHCANWGPSSTRRRHAVCKKEQLTPAARKSRIALERPSTPRGSELAFTPHCRCEMQALRQFRDLPHHHDAARFVYPRTLHTAAATATATERPQRQRLTRQLATNPNVLAAPPSVLLGSAATPLLLWHAESPNHSKADVQSVLCRLHLCDCRWAMSCRAPSLHPAHKVCRIFAPDHKKQCVLKLHTQSHLDEIVRMVNDRSSSLRRRRWSCGQQSPLMLNELDASQCWGRWWRCCCRRC